ncbi:vWA domain-containing protein [Streptomyces fulvoviolaceus]|uniref:vWA domain-containing protein n=1 Tax=Streptomyces fulvoviolaceus TaxID=285535 RepID=UPI0021BFC3E1|nr:hypothetical protein [Streptomyces fulvoviolaceus]MCT9080112.1 hypothetical protein [Streptomyces fulvoviolaceus]
MSHPVTLIAGRSPVPRFAVGPTKAKQPHLAVVYATPSGDVQCFDGRPMGPGRQMFSRYHMRYEVDMRPQTRTAALRNDPLVSQDGVHAFEVQVSYTFRVDGWEGAERWVRSGLPDALAAVHGYLVARFHGAGQYFDIEDPFGLQAHLNRLCATEVSLPEGLRVYDCRVSVGFDASSREFREALINSEWEERKGAAQHVPNMGDAERRGQVDQVALGFQITSRNRLKDELSDALTNSEGLIKLYAIRNPDDIQGAFAMSRQLEEARAATAELQNQRALALFQLMADRGLILSGDLDHLRGQLTGQVGAATGAPPELAAARPWDPPAQLAPAPAQTPPLPPNPPPQTPTLFAEPTPTVQVPSPPNTPARSAFTGAALIYLVLDESLAPESLDELNRGLAALHSALSGAPAVSAALRLCVLGMAVDTQLRLPLDTVLPGTRTPILSGRPGLSYEHAFRTLHALLRQDVALVKARRTQVLRPIVFFLTGGVPDEGAEWRTAYRELTDQAGNPTAPHVIAVGFGGAEAQAVRGVATRPEFGFMAPPNQDAPAAAHSCAAFLRDRIVVYGQRLTTGDPQFSCLPPDGFRLAEDAL